MLFSTTAYSIKMFSSRSHQRLGDLHEIYLYTSLFYVAALVQCTQTTKPSYLIKVFVFAYFATVGSENTPTQSTLLQEQNLLDFQLILLALTRERAYQTHPYSSIEKQSTCTRFIFSTRRSTPAFPLFSNSIPLISNLWLKVYVSHCEIHL